MKLDERIKAALLGVKSDLSKRLVRIANDHPIDMIELGPAAGVGESMGSRWASQSCGDTIGLAHVVVLGKRFPAAAHDLMRWAGDQLDLVIAQRIRTEATRDHLVHVATLARESGEALSTYATAVADGKVDDDELARLDRELRDLEEAAAGLRAWVDGERAARVVPLRKGRVA